MEPILSTADSGDFDRGQHNGHRTDLLIADLRATEPRTDLSPELIAEQSTLLDADIQTFLAEEPLPSTDEQPAVRDEGAVLPGFEALTDADLRLCPDWCRHQNLPVHSDGFDTDPEHAPHQGIEHTITAIHGGESIDHAGRAEVTLQLEQEHDLSTGPVVTVAVVVRGIEQYAWLTLPETRALHHALTHLLTEPDG